MKKFLYYVNPQFEAQSIDVLRIEPRQYNACRRNGINTLGDIANTPMEKLTRMKLMGQLSIKIIHHAFFKAYMNSLNDKQKAEVIKSLETLNCPMVASDMEATT